MATEDRTRHNRLRSLLPRSYATDPRESALGVVLEVLADRLRESDRSMERALRDRWLRSSGARESISIDAASSPDRSVPALPEVSLAGHPHPLELLGATLGLRRQPWESDHEGYRSRVRILGPLLAQGLATPRAVLSFALTSLAAEPCPVLEQTDGDTTRAYGMPTRGLDRCRLCKGGQRVPPGSLCPQRERAIMQALLTDNPRTRGVLIRNKLDPTASDDTELSPGAVGLCIRNDSLFSARPELTLRVPPSADPDTKLIPQFTSTTTGEQLTLPTVLRPGDVLHIRPASPHDPMLARQLQHWVDPPDDERQRPARAWVRRELAGHVEVEELEAVSLYLAGDRFDQARFDDEDEDIKVTTNSKSQQPGSFVNVLLGALTPELVPGANDWVFKPLASAELLSVLTDYESLAPLELLTPALLAEAEPFAAATCKVELELRWWTRPPARFRLRVPPEPAVERALAAGAAEYLRAMIERVRPAGVGAIIELALAPVDAELAPEDDREPEPGGDAGFMGIFDDTGFDASCFGAKSAQPPIHPETT